MVGGMVGCLVGGGGVKLRTATIDVAEKITVTELFSPKKLSHRD